MVRLLSFIAGLFFLAGLNACSSDPGLQFENPQPLTASEEAGFPAALWGQYLNAQDSSLLTLTATTLVRKTHYLAPNSVQELDQDSIPYKLANGRLYTAEFPQGLPVRRHTPDSLYVLVTSLDTLFAKSATHQLRKFKGQYFLNRQVAPNRWAVICLKPEGRQSLQLQRLDDSIDRAKLQEILPVKKDEDVYLSNPSQKELRKFLRQGGFRHRETFTRVSQL
jgi:hypothetical protein